MTGCDTIAAVATAPGLGAIAVVRVSGPLSRDIAHAVSRRPKDAFAHRKATLTTIHDASGRAIDDTLLTLFNQPHSFTGEDVLEISCHGGLATVRAVLAAVLDAGARPAEPGEFTRQAFLNGKLDLSQAEAVNQMIRSRTETQMSAARQALEGAMSRRLSDVRSALYEVSAAIEASIDFPEDVDEPDRGDLAERLDALAGNLGRTLELARRGQLLATGIRMAIVGRPNVGKSSLLNLLAGRPRAIVSETPGTTRDFLEETVQVGGVPITAIDTAGIRQTDDPVELEGTRRAVEALSQADIGLVVLDASNGLTDADEEVLELANSKAVAVWNKMDLVREAPDDMVRFPETRTVRMSALEGTGLSELEDAVLAGIGAGAGYFEESISASERQVRALREALECVGGAADSCRAACALDLAAVQLQSARIRLGEITGEDVTEALLDSIFGTFCLGK